MTKRAHTVKRSVRPLEPITKLIWVEGSSLTEISPQEINSNKVGIKAVGLSSIPIAWTKPFFCVCGAIAPEKEALSRAISESGISANARLLVRSSGTAESIERRGALESSECNRTDLFREINRLREAHEKEANVHWVIQELIECRAKGHLSNERRVAQDKRDWVGEIESGSLHPAETFRVGLRKWRDSRPTIAAVLNCVHRESIVDYLRIVAAWSYDRLIRVHYEWVWDGRAVYIVQADPCDEIAEGVDPRHLVKSLRENLCTAPRLEGFRSAAEADFSRYRKLENARIYRDLGYDIVPFFVLDSEIEINLIVRDGNCSDALKRDLELLTAQPLVIRTDGRDTPKHLREMLPRSDELRSAAAAESWLLGDFRSKVNARIENGECLADSGLCLIAHHFVPAAAAAWCQALPNQRKVRIESLWGIPEGLYWYAYDTFDVDTQVITNAKIDARPADIKIREKCRYKEHFIAPNDVGAWVVHRTSSKADWVRSITKDEWIQEIAWTSRCIAERQGKPVVVMWFIDVSPKASRHRVMPWFHMESKPDGLKLKAAPRKKSAGSREVILQTRKDWQDIQKLVCEGNSVVRIRVDPREPEMVRDQHFVKGLAELAKKNDIVIELSGGILSHAYYMLSDEGCDVECADLDDFALNDVAVEFNKLVRDGIPSAIVSRGETVATLLVRSEALVAALRRKLVEEAFEVLDAKSNDQITEELADLREVSLSIMAELGIAESNVEAVRRQKIKKRGGFKEGVMLGRTAISPPIVAQVAQADLFPLETGQVIQRTVTRAIDLPSTIIDEMHLDLRHNSQGVAERQLSTIVPAYAAGFVPPKVQFNLNTQDGHPHELIAELEVDRKCADLRIRIRLKNTEQQLNLAIDI